MDSVLILGAASVQVPLIKFVKQRGFRTIVVSIPGPYPGFEIADRSIYKDVRDVQGILESIAKEHIVAVLTDQTDITVPVVAYIAQELHLPGNDVRVATIYSNKSLMRAVCRDIGIRVPCFIRANNAEDVSLKLSSLSLPVIMKPEDNQGSRGIHLIKNPEDIYKNIDDSLSYSKTGYVIIEDFFKGREVVCEGFVIDGEYLNWGIGDRKYFNLEGLFIPNQTVFPSNINDSIKKKILDSERKIHKTLKPSFGMIHSEYLIDEITGDYILVETALRGGGVYISSHLIPLYTHYNNYELLFNCSMGNNCSLSYLGDTFNYGASAYLCFTLPEGVIISIEGTECLMNMDFVKYADIENLKIGAKIQPLVNKTQRLGPIIIGADNRTEVEENISRIKNILKINVMTGNNTIQGIKWE